VERCDQDTGVKTVRYRSSVFNVEELCRGRSGGGTFVSLFFDVEMAGIVSACGHERR
jgi:hypothetical protein